MVGIEGIELLYTPKCSIKNLGAFQANIGLILLLSHNCLAVMALLSSIRRYVQVSTHRYQEMLTYLPDNRIPF